MSRSRRHNRTDSLTPVNEPRWLVVRNRLSQAIEQQPLPPGADLRGHLEARRAALAADGWHVEDIPHYCAFFFADQGPDRVCVSVECYKPGHAPMR